MKAEWINRRIGEIIAWRHNGVRYALIEKNGKFYDQDCRIINNKTLKAAIEAAMK